MRILHVIPSLEKGGAERYCADVCAELNKRRGIEVMLLSMSPANKYSFITDQLNYKVCNSKVLPSISGKGIFETTEYEQIVQDFKPDIIHSHLFWAELLTREIYFPSAKYVTHCQNNMPEFRNIGEGNILKKSTWTTWWEKKWMIKRYRRCKNNFLVISKDTEAYYRRVLPKDLHRITLMYHAINFDKFNRANTNRLNGLDHIRIVYVARFAVYKNHSFLVDIVESLKKKNKKVTLHFLGKGEEMDTVEQKVQHKGLEKEIYFEGEVDDVESFLQQANVYVHPAYYEPFGLVIIEAMAAGLPVICLDGKGNRDLIEQGRNGYMFYEQDPDLFADKIIEIFSSPETYRSIAENAIQYASQFDIKQHTNRLLEYYSSI